MVRNFETGIRNCIVISSIYVRQTSLCVDVVVQTDIVFNKAMAALYCDCYPKNKLLLFFASSVAKTSAE